MFETGEPYAGAALADAFVRLQHETRAYLDVMPPSAFFAPQGRAWAPAAHVRHLTTTAYFVGWPLRLPKIFLAVFGRGKGPSRDFAVIRDEYLAALAGGSRAFSDPSPESPAASLAAGRERLVAGLDRAVDHLAAGIARWDEADLDRYRLPHPSLAGPVTVREMLCSVLYHHAHHMRRVAERASAGEAAGSGAFRT